jgi:lipoate-protein ligase A
MGMHGEYKVPGGKLVVADLDVQDGKLTHVEISGDFFLEPPEALKTITQALEGLPTDLSPDEIAAEIDAALSPEVVMIGFSPEAIAHAIGRALA